MDTNTRYVDLGHGFRAVPPGTISLNGFYMPRDVPDDGPLTGRCAVLAPNGKALDGEKNAPYIYDSVEDARESVASLVAGGEYSTCGGCVVIEAQETVTTHTTEPLVMLQGSDSKGWDLETRERSDADAKLVARVNRREDAVLFVSAAGMFDALSWLGCLVGSDHPHDWSEATIDEVDSRIGAALGLLKSTPRRKPAGASPITASERPRPTIEQAIAACEAIAKAFDIDADCVEETVDIEPAPWFILVEMNVDTGDPYFTGHDSAEAAVEYSVLQEDADRWKADSLYDVAKGKWVVGEVTAMVEHSATFDDRGAA